MKNLLSILIQACVLMYGKSILSYDYYEERERNLRNINLTYPTSNPKI